MELRTGDRTQSWLGRMSVANRDSCRGVLRGSSRSPRSSGEASFEHTSLLWVELLAEAAERTQDRLFTLTRIPFFKDGGRYFRLGFDTNID